MTNNFHWGLDVGHVSDVTAF